MADLDIGKMFLNFMLHPKVQPYAAVEVTSYFPVELSSFESRSKRIVWERWAQCGMGFRSSPYQAGQAMLHAEEHLRGDPLDVNNLIHYDVIVLNLPGYPDYNPSNPWVFKFHSCDGNNADDFS